MAVPTTKVITLLEQEKLNKGVDPNGTFSINLDEEVILKEGESIELTKAFVDTTSSEETFITVDDDETEITITHGMYMTDLEPNQTGPVAKPSFGLWSENVAYRPDAKRYVLCNEVDSYVNTFFDWEQANNTFAPVLTANFGSQIKGLVPADNTGFEYVVQALNPPSATPSYPASPGLVLSSEYMIGGHMILNHKQTSTDSKFEFFFYPNGYTPSGSVPGPNDHTAVFDQFTVGGNTNGWRAKANPDTTETTENRKWLFLSDADGYNYFDAGTQGHMVQLNSIKLPVDFEWTAPYKNGSPDFSQACYPGLVISYYDPRTQRTNLLTKIFNATAYDPVTKDGVQVGGGMTTLEPLLTKDAIERIDLPDYFKDSKYGWGPNSGWSWVKFTQFVDPYQPTSTELAPKIVVSLSNLPRIQFYYFNKDGSPGEGTGFINTKSQYYSAANKHSQMVPWQCTDQTPIVNPETGGTVLTPREYTTKFTINSGQYTNADFAQLLTDKINAQPDIVVGLSNNPYGLAAQEGKMPVNLAGYSSSYFFQTTYELKQQADLYSPQRNFYPNNSVYAKVVTPERTLSDGTVLAEIPAKTSGNEGDQPFWVSEDGESLFQFDKAQVDTTTTARGCGASQFSFVFDETEQAFVIAQMHTPIYNNGPTSGSVTAPGNEVIKQVKVGKPSDATFLGIFKTADTSSGVFLTDMKPDSLFFTKMRLNRDILTDVGQVTPTIQDFTGADSSFTDGVLQSVMTHQVSLRPGGNITGLFSSTDALVRKQSSYAVQPEWGETIETDTLVSLIGQNQVQATEDDPYYQIEISGINNQDIVGQPAKNNLVQGMIGKYYSNGNFTQGEGDGLVYIHKGETPLVIKSLRVRILDSLGNVEPGLGPSSAMILDVNQEK
jgi:hypothetical protein